MLKRFLPMPCQFLIFQKVYANRLLIKLLVFGGEMMKRKKKMHWFAWWRLCIPKKEGGLGFRDLHSFNLALLTKQCWRLIQNPESLCAQVLKAKYYPDGDILKAGPKRGSSYTWQSIVVGSPGHPRPGPVGPPRLGPKIQGLGPMGLPMGWAWA